MREKVANLDKLEAVEMQEVVSRLQKDAIKLVRAVVVRSSEFSSIAASGTESIHEAEGSKKKMA